MYTNSVRVMYDMYDINELSFENSSIAEFDSLYNIVHKWNLNKTKYLNSFTIIDKKRPKIFNYNDEDLSETTSITKQSYNRAKFVISKLKNKVNINNETINVSFNTALYRLNQNHFSNYSRIKNGEIHFKTIDGEKNSFKVGKLSLFDMSNQNVIDLISTEKNKDEDNYNNYINEYLVDESSNESSDELSDELSDQ